MARTPRESARYGATYGITLSHAMWVIPSHVETDTSGAGLITQTRFYQILARGVQCVQKELRKDMLAYVYTAQHNARSLAPVTGMSWAWRMCRVGSMIIFSNQAFTWCGDRQCRRREQMPVLRGART